MDETRDGNKKGDSNETRGFWLKWILMVFLSPLACLLFMLRALQGLLIFFSKAALLFIIVAINTPFAAMYNFSILVAKYNDLAYYKKLDIETRWNWRIAKTDVAVEIKLFVSDFIKVVAPELLVVISAGVITYFTAPILVFGISTGVWVLAIIHKWLNTDCLSRTALSCLCDCLGLSPLTFFFSFIGFFDIGCHPVAKCTFAAERAFRFLKDDIEKGDSKLDGEDCPNNREKVVYFETIGANLPGGNGAEIEEENLVINFTHWNAFYPALFLLHPRITFSKEGGRNYILKSSMVLKLGKKILGYTVNICEYHVETLELAEDYIKVIHLNSFLKDLKSKNGFVTDKMRGQYESSFTLSQIVEGVEKNKGYRIREPIDKMFVVAGCIESEKEKHEGEV